MCEQGMRAGIQVRNLAVVLGLWLAAGAMSAADTALIVGGGRIGSWLMTGYVANASFSTVTLNTEPLGQPCPALCQTPSAFLPALGSLSLESVLARVGKGLNGFEPYYFTAFVENVANTPQPFPDVRARFVDQSNPGRSVEIPVVMLSQLMAANPSTLSFSGVARDGPARSNLVLANVIKTDGSVQEDLPVTLELFDSGGNLVGSRSLTVPYLQTTLIGDVASYLGAGSLSLGQLRVTRTSGNALMWGILYTVDENGAVTSTPGARLSP